MSIDAHTQAILLLCTHFTRPTKESPAPLTPTEYGRLAGWLDERQTNPEDLFEHPEKLLSGWTDPKITLSRIQSLFCRASILGAAIEKWFREGVWVISRADSRYPNRLKDRLGPKSPPLLFGRGNQTLLQTGGIAVVGSRNATEADRHFSSRLGQEAAIQGHSIVSGGARGVDESAMLSALDHGGSVIGVLADNLLRAVTSAKYRSHLLMNNLVLISPFHPEARFEIGNAMTRNKYIYCLSDAAIVVASAKEKGGTWHGALENLKRNWVPLWIRAQSDTQSGNTGLIQKGGIPFPDEPIQFNRILNVSSPEHSTDPLSSEGVSGHPSHDHPHDPPSEMTVSHPPAQKGLPFSTPDHLENT